MSEQMPRFWWSPSEGLLDFRHGKWWPAGDRFDGATWDELPGDAVELQPVSGDTEWGVSLEDLVDDPGPHLRTYSSERNAKDALDYYRLGSDSGWYRNCRLVRRTVSEWQEVTDV